MVTRAVVECLYLCACALYLLGASRSYRTAASGRSVAIMTAAVIIGSAVSFVPLRGGGPSRVAMSFGSGMRAASLLLEMLTVWLLFPAALIFWSRGRRRLFHRLVLTGEVGWVTAAMLLLYGLYWTPAR